MLHPLEMETRNQMTAAAPPPDLMQGLVPPPAYEEASEPPPLMMLQKRPGCPFFQKAPPGQSYNLSYWFTLPMSCAMFFYHMLLFCLFLATLLLGISLAICTSDHTFKVAGRSLLYHSHRSIDSNSSMNCLNCLINDKKLSVPFIQAVPSRVRRASMVDAECHQCITTATYGNHIIHTLLHTNIPPLGATKVDTCIHDNIQYDIYKGPSGKNWCSNPTAPKSINLTVYGGHLIPNKWFKHRQLYYISSVAIPKTKEVKYIPIEFDVCELIDSSSTWDGSDEWKEEYKNNDKYLCYEDDEMLQVHWGDVLG
uniref:Uncharacterized protein n=1 Tax=Micrurus spixii TaxID=129469 RepID=A0A2D4LZD2_9SAUR